MFQRHIMILNCKFCCAYCINLVSGNGPFYSAGNDLSGFRQLAEEHGGDIYKAAAAAGVRLETFVDSFIQFPKPLVALVNGPAVGIPVTTLG